LWQLLQFHATSPLALVEAILTSRSSSPSASSSDKGGGDGDFTRFFDTECVLGCAVAQDRGGAGALDRDVFLRVFLFCDNEPFGFLLCDFFSATSARRAISCSGEGCLHSTFFTPQERHVFRTCTFVFWSRPAWQRTSNLMQASHWLSNSRNVDCSAPESSSSGSE
jgi:hypothetical protein